MKLLPGHCIWFAERQRNGSTKRVPGVVLFAKEDEAIVARGTSQSYDRGFSSDGALSFGPSDALGRRLKLTCVTRFRSDDVKWIKSAGVDRCGICPRGDQKRIKALTAERVRELAAGVRAAVSEGAERDRDQSLTTE